MVTLLGALPISSSDEMDFSEPFKHIAVLIDQNKIKFSVKKKKKERNVCCQRMDLMG